MCQEANLPFLDLGVAGKVSGIDGIHFDKVWVESDDHDAFSCVLAFPFHGLTHHTHTAHTQEAQSSLARAVCEAVKAQLGSELA
jgi:hypothetical protein